MIMVAELYVGPIFSNSRAWGDSHRVKAEAKANMFVSLHIRSMWDTICDAVA